MDLIPADEQAQIAAAALTALNGQKLELPRLPDDELRGFVLGVIGRSIFTSAEIRDPNLIGMVFMPLALMPPVEAVTKAAETAAPDPGPRPEVPKPPPAPPPLKRLPEPVKPPTPPPPEPLEPDPDVLAKIDRDVSWSLSPDQSAVDSRAEYLNTVALRNVQQTSSYQRKLAELEEAHIQALIEWEADCDRKQAADEKALADHKLALTSHVKSVATAQASLETWELADERHRVAFRAAQGHYMQDIGGFWEYLNQAGPRGINGMPCFFSCRIMHKEDWKRAVAAINREIERQARIEI